MSKLTFEFCAVPKSILNRKDWTPTEKLLYSVLLGFQCNGDSWASNETLAEILGCHENTINNCLRELENKKAIKRETQQINKFKKERLITANFIPTDHKNCGTEPQKLCPHDHKNCGGGDHKNCASIDNSLINNLIERGNAPNLEFLKLTDEVNIGSGRLKLANSEFLALTYNEADMIENILKQANLVSPEQVKLVIITANAIAEGSESRKATSKSFLYLKSAIDDLLKTRKINQDLKNAETRSGQPVSNLEKLPTRKIFKATPKEKPSEAAIQLVTDLTKKLCG